MTRSGPVPRRSPAIALAVAVVASVMCSWVAKSEAATGSTQDQHFFPARPAHVALHTITGTLVDYGIGNASGSVVIAHGKMKTDFYTGAHLRIDGREIACDFPPIKGKSQSDFCTSWPSNVVLGTTVVTATYWTQPRPGFPGSVKVTDALHTASTSNHP